MNELVTVSEQNFNQKQTTKTRLVTEERHMLQNAYKNFVAKKRATLRRLQEL